MACQGLDLSYVSDLWTLMSQGAALTPQAGLLAVAKSRLKMKDDWISL